MTSLPWRIKVLDMEILRLCMWPYYGSGNGVQSQEGKKVVGVGGISITKLRPILENSIFDLPYYGTLFTLFSMRRRKGMEKLNMRQGIPSNVYWPIPQREKILYSPWRLFIPLTNSFHPPNKRGQLDK